jgi:hypothetical protein
MTTRVRKRGSGGGSGGGGGGKGGMKWSEVSVAMSDARIQLV